MEDGSLPHQELAGMENVRTTETHLFLPLLQVLLEIREEGAKSPAMPLNVTTCSATSKDDISVVDTLHHATTNKVSVSHIEGKALCK